MKKTGTIQLTGELTLKDFSWEIARVDIDVLNKEVKIEVLMWENHFKHSRVFTFTPNVGSVAYTKVTDFIDLAKARLLAMPMFKDSTE